MKYKYKIYNKLLNSFKMAFNWQKNKNEIAILVSKKTITKSMHKTWT